MSEQDRTSTTARAERKTDGENKVLEERSAAMQRFSRLATVLALFALLAIAISLFIGYRYWSGMQQSLQQLNSSIAQANRDQAEIRQHLTETHQAFQQQQQKIALQEQNLVDQLQQLQQERETLSQQGTQLTHSLSLMRQRLGGDTSQWQVAEAEYLLRVANHRLTLMYDPLTALAALQSAEQRLRDTGDPGWDDVRDLLAQEIRSLASVPKVDKAELVARMSALVGQVDQLPLREEGVAINKDEVAAVSEVGLGSDTGFNLLGIWQDLWDGFKSLVVIRHHQQPIAAMLPPEQGYFLKQNLLLKLEGANIALMGRNPALYQESLQTAVAWIDRYFATDAAAVETFREQLMLLAEEEIAPELPRINTSLHALQSYRKEMHQEVSE